MNNLKIRAMKHINKIIFIFLSVSVLFFSCSKDFLDRKQTGVQTEEAFYTTMDNIKLGVNGTYGSLNSLVNPINTLDVMYIVFGSIASDDAEAGGEAGGNDFIDIQDADKGTTQPEENKQLSDYFWAYNYKTILRATSTLQGINSFRSANPGLSQADLKTLNQYEGEMYFILAFIHFKLIQVYGGIIIVDRPLGGSSYNLPRDSISACLHFVESCLRKASNLLPLQSQYAAADMGRATKGAAQGFLAKAYLYEASYAENYPGDMRFSGCKNTYNLAMIYADSVINSGEYYLLGMNGDHYNSYWDSTSSPTYPNFTPGYRYIFTSASKTYKNPHEAVFETQSLNDKLGYQVTRGTYLTVYMTVRNYNGTTLGWGFNCPTQDLVNAYDTLDPRFKVSIGRTGDPVYLNNSWGKINCMQSPTNMIGRKFEADSWEYWGNHTTDGAGPNNFPYLRYADVVLMAAEAAIKAGVASLPLSNKTPLQLVNMIRQRARNNDMSAVPADLPSVGFNDVVNERRLELAMEGQRFFDLVRWKQAEAKINGQALQNFLNGKPQASPVSASFILGRNEFFPIPESETINDPNLVQYPGWN